MTEPAPEPGVRARAAQIARIVLRLGLLLGMAYGVHLLIDWATALTAKGHPGAQTGMLVMLLLVYALLIAVPFVPGIEIGLSLLMLEGAWIAPFIYGATVIGLLLAYSAGEWMPYSRLHRLFADLHMHRICTLLERLQPLDRTERVNLLHDRAPRWLRPFVSRYRYLLLAVLINLPGNAVVGGGGGILFLAGFSRMFRPAAMALTIALAVAPVPLAVWAFGIDILG